MNPSLIIPTLMVLLAMACSPATAQGRFPSPFRPPFRRPFPRRPSPSTGGGAPSRAQAEEFLRSNPVAQRQLASFKARAASQPQYAVPPCPCTQVTCDEKTSFTFRVMDGLTRCITIFPFGVSSTDCTMATNGAPCSDIMGCGAATGTCTNWNPTIQTVFAVCFPTGDPIYVNPTLGVPVNNGCCCT